MKRDIYKKIAKEVINTEIVSLNKLKNSLDMNFKKAVEKILNCKKGKVILSGVGKSGIIAKKISSTVFLKFTSNEFFNLFKETISVFITSFAIFL